MGDIYHTGDTYAGSVPIDDTQTTATNTWSAQKINNEIDTKASKSIITSNDVFDPTKAYVAGDWLIHNNILYEVLVACTGVTPPNSTYYKVKTVHDLKSEIDALKVEVQYEDISVTITPSTGNTVAVNFNNIGTDIGFEMVYNNDYYYLTGEVRIYLSQLANHRATIRLVGQTTQDRTITVRRYYMI